MRAEVLWQAVKISYGIGESSCFVSSLIHALQVSDLTAEFKKERERFTSGA